MRKKENIEKIYHDESFAAYKQRQVVLSEGFDSGGQVRYSGVIQISPFKHEVRLGYTFTTWTK